MLEEEEEEGRKRAWQLGRPRFLLKRVAAALAAWFPLMKASGAREGEGGPWAALARSLASLRSGPGAALCRVRGGDRPGLSLGSSWKGLGPGAGRAAGGGGGGGGPGRSPRRTQEPALTLSLSVWRRRKGAACLGLPCPRLSVSLLALLPGREELVPEGQLGPPHPQALRVAQEEEEEEDHAPPPRCSVDALSRGGGGEEKYPEAVRTSCPDSPPRLRSPWAKWRKKEAGHGGRGRRASATRSKWRAFQRRWRTGVKERLRRRAPVFQREGLPEGKHGHREEVPGWR
ncbi:uncharacterized protein LOC121920429 [Sceloporus undulatus]|uniref:uncharacterized protein LOC121920429 n=1 Tax=Sceloporus undulatus TaxID=8520 RepID=UPI001C4D565F|nr:uncharacterized protein LOC121920429 [Sceloporus undulatus]